MNLRSTFYISIFILLTACGGNSNSSGDTTSNEGEINNTKNINGIAGAGTLSGSDVNIYSVKSPEISIGNTVTASNGEFELKNLQITDDEFYVLKICNGKTTDINSNGIKEVFNIANEGCIHSLLKGKSISNQKISVNSLSDMIFISMNGLYANKSMTDIENYLNEKSKVYITDINLDGIVNYQDVQVFNPKKDKERLLFNYSDISSIYLSGIYNNDGIISMLKRVLLIDRPILTIVGGLQQDTGTKVITKLTNTPLGTTNEVFIDGNSQSSSNEIVNEEGIHVIESVIKVNGSTIGSIQKDLMIATTKEVASTQIVDNEDNTIVVTLEDSYKLNGTEILIPQNSTNITNISILETTAYNDGVSDGKAVSEILTLEPSGTEFSAPVQIKLPYNLNISEEEAKKIEIARYSKMHGLDYLQPDFVDTTNKLIYFKTNHFSSFWAKTPFSLSGDQWSDTVSYLNMLAGKDLGKDRWETILKGGLQKKLTIYDFYREYRLSESIHSLIINDRNYVGAIAALFPSKDAIDDRKKRWDSVYTGLKIIEFRNPTDNLGSLFNLEVNLAKIHFLMGQSQDHFDSGASYTPLAPVSMGSEVFNKLLELDQNHKLELVFTEADLDGGWSNGIYSDTQQINQNIGIVYRKYDEFRKHAEDLRKAFLELIEAQITYLDNINDPYLQVTVTGIDGYRFTQWGHFYKTDAASYIDLSIDVSALGIRPFDPIDLKYELVKDIDTSNEVRIQGSSLIDVQFKLLDKAESKHYVLVVTHVPTGVTYEYHGINIQTVENKFELQSSSLLANKKLSPDENIKLSFDSEINPSSIESSIYFYELSTSTTIKYDSGLWDYDFGGDFLSPDKRILIIDAMKLNHGEYELRIDSSLLSKVGESLSSNYKFKFLSYRPQAFTTYAKSLENKGNSAVINFQVYNKTDATKITFTTQLSSGATKEGALNIPPSGGPGATGFELCFVDAATSIVGGRYIDGFVNYSTIQTEVINATNERFDGDISIELCSASNECENYTFRLNLAADSNYSSYSQLCN